MPDTITITKAEYTMLLTAAKDGNNLKELICHRAKNYGNLSHADLTVLKDLYFYPDEEDKA